LRTIAHLRPRTNKYGALFRVRSRLAHAIHQFFQDRGFYYIHTPILTASDCEGAGEMFGVTTLDLNNIPKRDGRVDFSEDFFGKEAKLTVSGQLSGEMFALGLGEILYLRSHLSRREFQHRPPYGRILDDRAGDGFP
jgi:asparaginyl-tRNA synthetase